MMIVSVQQAKYELLAYIKEFDPAFSNWYVGVSGDPKRSLFECHGVQDAHDPWLYKQLLTNRAARTVQEYFVRQLGASGTSTAEDSEDHDCIYLYKIAAHTRQMK
jgi:hypothetical protein